MGNVASSSSYTFSRFTRTGHGIMDVGTHCKIPRLQSNHWLSCPSADVRHPNHLSFIRGSRFISILGIFKPHGSSGRNLSFCLVRQRFFLRPAPHLFRNGRSMHFVIRHVFFQAYGKTRRRLSIIHEFISRYRSYKSFQKIPFGDYRDEQPQGRPWSLVG